VALALKNNLHIVARTAAAVLGGYVFTWGAIVLGMVALSAAGMDFHDAEHLSYIVAMLIFLVVFLWAYAAASLRRVWLVLVGGGALMSGAAALGQHWLI
jgi:hypothetical protein